MSERGHAEKEAPRGSFSIFILLEALKALRPQNIYQLKISAVNKWHAIIFDRWPTTLTWKRVFFPVKSEFKSQGAAVSEVRMVEDDLMFSTYGQVYEIDCARHHYEVDHPIIHFKENLNQAIIGRLPPESVADLRLDIYNEITSKFVKENVFCQYMYKTLPSCNHLWAFRKKFAVQLALSGFMSYVLQIGGQTPNKILFAKTTGKIFQIDFQPAYDPNGMIELNEPVPFRLTRNLQSFFMPFGVDGIFVSAMCAAAQSIVAQKSQHVQHHLAMLFRDELLSWSCRKSATMSSEPTSVGAINPIDFEQKVTTNVEQVIGRIKGISPHSFPEKDMNATELLQSVHRGVTELVEAALQPTSLCMMDPTWHPWF